jgi:mannose-1-phosphate guanylyltransferase
VPGARYAVILAGGKGERFWPLSTSRRPKQLLSLVGDRPLLAQAVERLDGVIPADNVFVVTAADLVEATRLFVPDLRSSNIVGEPLARDTAAAIATGAGLVRAQNPRAAFCVLTADHVIGDLDVFRSTLRQCLALAEERSALVTIGIPPRGPSTAYGYIECGPSIPAPGPVEFLEARRFVEKPDIEKARAYCSGRRHLWNSGMFIWTVKAFEDALARHRPQLSSLVRRVAEAGGVDAVREVLAEIYPGLERISIDYALMEKAGNIVVARGGFAWDDVGSWTALESHFASDADGNVRVGSCASLDAKDNIVVSDSGAIALLGVSGLVVVRTPDVTLVCSKERAQDIKKLLERMRSLPDLERLL